ncbi:hypothetical protein [Sphingomonas sp.]|uniref:hypothetical protein n=1 Tax=Sphingomonas sp. TaxID=28214 RepID=UPI003CC550E9
MRGRLILLVAAALALGGAAGRARPPRRPAAAPPATRAAATPATTVLIGLRWLGLWRDGRVTLSHDVAGFTLGAARWSADGRTLEIAADRDGATESESVVLLFDARTLAPRGQRIDAEASGWAVRTPIGTDRGVPDDRRLLPRGLAARAGNLSRVVVSPDRRTAAVFTPPPRAGMAWPGRRWDLTSGRSLTGVPLTINDGSTSETGLARAVACLLPRGEGVIYTLEGPPADRVSQFQSFLRRYGAITLRTRYVMSCLAAAA